MDGRNYGWMYMWMEGWIDEWMDSWMDAGWMHEWEDRWMGGWENRWMDRCMNGRVHIYYYICSFRNWLFFSGRTYHFIKIFCKVFKLYQSNHPYNLTIYATN